VLALYLVVYLLITCDILLTNYALSELGLAEGNPFMRMLIERFGIHMAAAVVMLVASAVLIFLSILNERLAVIVMIIFYSGIVAINGINILLHLVYR